MYAKILIAAPINSPNKCYKFPQPVFDKISIHLRSDTDIRVPIQQTYLADLKTNSKFSIPNLIHKFGQYLSPIHWSCFLFSSWQPKESLDRWEKGSIVAVDDSWWVEGHCLIVWRQYWMFLVSWNRRRCPYFLLWSRMMFRVSYCLLVVACCLLHAGLVLVKESQRGGPQAIAFFSFNLFFPYKTTEDWEGEGGGGERGYFSLQVSLDVEVGPLFTQSPSSTTLRGHVFNT